MRRSIIAATVVTAIAFTVAPADAGDDRDAVRAACQTYAQVQTETYPSASPGLQSPPARTRPPGGGIQAPGTERLERDVQAPGFGHDSAFQRAFQECERKLGS